MTARPSSRAGPGRSGPTDPFADVRRAAPLGAEGEIDSYVTRYVLEHPSPRFGDIVEAVRGRFHTSRATAARHLAKLVQLRDLEREPDGSYSLRPAGADPLPPEVEFRWVEMTVVVRPEGSSRLLCRYESRVTKGQQRWIARPGDAARSEFDWWSSQPAHLRWLPTPPPTWPDSMDFGPMTARLQLESPSRPGNRWNQLATGNERLVPVRMHREAPPRSDKGGPLARRECEYDSLEQPSGRPDGRRFRMHPEAHLRFQILFPPEYPFRAPAAAAYDLDRPRLDRAETVRIRRLSRTVGSQEGLRRHGPSVSLELPHPLLDRRYLIQWGLPRAHEYRTWLARLRLRASSEPSGPSSAERKMATRA
ncbi:MAG: hypothetical protein L3K03_00200 [Thermoplasmata archaeon]|nr:hypothetical protein [Thermoplasmata archaeon]